LPLVIVGWLGRIVSSFSSRSQLQWENGHRMEKLDSQLTPGSGEAYEEDRKSRIHRNRLVGFFLCVVLWVLSVVPLARQSMHGREGAGAVAVYLAVGAITFGVAAVIRGLYVLLTKRNFWWSPWVFVLAAVAATLIFLVQSAG